MIASVTQFWREIRLAMYFGAGLEAILCGLSCEANFRLSPPNPWLEISQSPGAQIALQVFSHMAFGYVLALVAAFLIQSALFTVRSLRFDPGVPNNQDQE